MSARTIDGVRACWISIVLLVVSLPHVVEDFAFGEPARVGVAASVALTVLIAAYAAQLAGVWLALRGSRWGGRITAATGLVWFAGALLVHGPEIGSAGLHWRLGPTSVAQVMLIVVVSALAVWYGAMASQKVTS